MTIKRAVAAAALATINFSLAACGGEYEPDDFDAYAACENWVEEQLRAPSTADFSGHNDSTIAKTAVGYEIDGYVDAENGFGSQIRTDWSCSVQLTADSWRLLNLDVS